MRKLLIGLVLGFFIFEILNVFGVLADDNNTTLSCGSNNLSLCLNETSCESAGGEWEDNVCSTEEQEIDDNETENGNVVTANKTRISRENLTFTPWQKRNESECLEGCSCHGAVMSCETETGRIITIQAGRSGNIIIITIDGTEVETELEVETETNGNNETKLKAKMSDGTKKEIKVMPDVAAEKALERLKLKVCSEENSCVIHLKEVGNKATYEIQAERHARILGLFQAKMQVKAQVSAENGEVIKIGKPWWAFLATEPEE